MEKEDYQTFIDSLAKQKSIEKAEVEFLQETFNLSFDKVVKDITARKVVLVLATRASHYLN